MSSSAVLLSQTALSSSTSERTKEGFYQGEQSAHLKAKAKTLATASDYIENSLPSGNNASLSPSLTPPHLYMYKLPSVSPMLISVVYKTEVGRVLERTSYSQTSEQ